MPRSMHPNKFWELRSTLSSWESWLYGPIGMWGVGCESWEFQIPLGLLPSLGNFCLHCPQSHIIQARPPGAPWSGTDHPRSSQPPTLACWLPSCHRLIEVAPLMAWLSIGGRRSQGRKEPIREKRRGQDHAEGGRCLLWEKWKKSIGPWTAAAQIRVRPCSVCPMGWLTARANISQAPLPLVSAYVGPIGGTNRRLEGRRKEEARVFLLVSVWGSV